jgi:hypothetical protein
MRFAEAAEEAAAQAARLRLGVLHQGGQLVVVAHQAKGLGAQERAQHHGQRHLAGLVHDADVKHAPLQDGARDSQARAADLQSVPLAYRQSVSMQSQRGISIL